MNQPERQKSEKKPVRIFREELGLTRFQVRLKTGIAERTLADIESGKSLPNLENFLSLTKLYKKSLKEMLKAMGLDVSGIPDDLPNKKPTK